MTVRRTVLLVALGIVAVIGVFLVRDRFRSQADMSVPPKSAADTSKRDLERAMTFTQPAEPAK